MDKDQEFWAILNYAGRDCMEPRRVYAMNFNIFDYDDIDELIKGLSSFRETALGRRLTIASDIEDGDAWDERARAKFMAYRLETPDEVAARVETYRSAVRLEELNRRTKYESLKREFEP